MIDHQIPSATDLIQDHAELADRVKAFVAHQTGMRVDRISLDTSLAWDIGLAGDDAVELFMDFAREFEIEEASFRSLDLRKHFGDEGIGCLGGLLIMAAAIPGCVLAHALGWTGWPGILLALLSLFVCGYVYGKLQAWYHECDLDTIRVKDLVEAAQAKKWVRNDFSSS